ncbi:bifunctional 5,10-methylenetetrahydrofolate dehydrogenase/5,10-methenyltetrahydrofolate cyclohydrolase [Streptomyces sp. A3M-1-3]|uniref:bifunctional 5,10-methylenetetrahydrofolate dehydrogenase/5,10-methenyltetrahydrofolate cyclohydrolase n=1 Tax=Streptomyces sp. A3M-1-3 TaxID=2962044 RepID=UPI0020B6D5D5|nr:bifunctional 5,10-methylenetetrahydrofolate dehydrogenase/5,10-methenyltetrahydrofolate cyclohydrolase [Streptomyces sp. A3M-1-3]MCP3822870.1 bifunctional 5,10-methylenetetrahydrofolate dehydrogenase/5,10-methenyltetrahydrofolate cyclohydrolase [Streptomyces sp. A3M-1-3]
MTRQLSGRDLLRSVREDLADYRARIEPAKLRVAVIRFLPTDTDPPEWAQRMQASRVSAEQKVRAFTHLGFAVDHVVLPGTVSAAEFAARIDACNADPAIRAVIVQFPPPARLTALVQRLDPAKDIDGLLGDRSLQRACATADGISRIVAAFDSGAIVAVVGARGFVGSGVVRLLEDRGTTVVPLDQGDDLSRAARADIVVSTAGSAHLLTPEHIRPHHRAVVDSGFSPQADGSVAGDIHPSAAGLPQNITPVPGGVGPVEMAVLMERIVRQVADSDLQSWVFPKFPYVTQRTSAARMRSTGRAPGTSSKHQAAPDHGAAPRHTQSTDKKRGGPAR